ncbi:MAG: hypothetical protein IT384_22225 [Deltaproteobacteria bacterium]|nr:hypothetical protein [Deltaproteobacteria bacterium]
MARIRSELRRKTRRTYLSLSALIEELNAYIRGVRQYFRRVLRRRLHSLDFFINERIARWWKRKHALRRPAWSLVQKGALQRRYGLERMWTPSAVRPATRKACR